MKTILTAIIIAKNEQDKIADCIDSVAWVQEILIIDTGSTDLTKDIAKRMGARIIEYKGSGTYDKWRNCGLKNAKGDWIFYIDADERATETLRNEINKIISTHTSLNAYAIPRKNYILGQLFNYSGQWPDYQKRLFRKSALKKWSGDIHEEPHFDGEIGHLSNPLKHIKHEDLTSMMQKTNQWSEIEARLMYDVKHPPMTVPRFMTGMFREFWLRMIRQKAYKEGKIGIIYALYQVFSRFTTYAKLWELQEKERMK